MKRLLSGILICAGMVGAVLLGGCVQTPQKPDIREGAAISPITAVFFPDDCTDFTNARFPTVQELRVSEENTAYTAVDGVIFTADLKTLIAFPAGRGGSYSVPDGTETIAAEAFADSRIEEVFIPDSVAAIGNRAFDGCMALKEISFPTVFAADGNILPHCAALPEYIIEGLRVHHRGEPNEIKDTLGDILPEMCPYRSRTCAKNEQGNLGRTITLYRLQKNHLDLSTGAIAEIVYTMQTAEYLMNGGDIVIPEGYTSWTENDLQYARFPITSVTFPNNVGVGNMILFMSDFGIDDYPFSMYDYYVKADNPRFVSVDGVIFTADLKSLVAFPIGRTGHYDIPDGTEIVEYGAFLDTHLESVYVPDSVRLVDDLGLNSLYLKSLSLPAHAADPSARFFGYAAITGLNTGSVPDDLIITYRAAASETSLSPASGGSGPCAIHNEVYHAFPDPWIAFVGSDAFYQWIAETSPTAEEKIECNLNGTCPYAKQNIYSFLHSMSYPKEVFIEQYNTDPWVDLRYNIDLLYGDDPTAAEEYYRTTNSALEDMRVEITALRTAKHKLRKAFPDQLSEAVNWKTNSLLEMMETAGISAADLKDIVSQQASGTTDAMKRIARGACDAAASLTADERKELLTGHSAFYQDCVLLGTTPYETPYEKQVADLAAKSDG